MQEKTGQPADIGRCAQAKLTEVGRLQRHAIGREKKLAEPDRNFAWG
ncbi:MAG: hypothetical protein KatS3mg110_3878 [Pirellulaceae bacterium]|nr:MAG: hypothetical protein KatS3mg110_3878 [Pirellulaceae bacterium]